MFTFQTIFCLLAAASIPATFASDISRRRRQDDDPSLPPLELKDPPGGGADKDSMVDIATLDTISKLVTSTPEFSILATALAKAGLVDTLAGTGPFTLFAPNNEAFEKMPAATLARLMGNTRMLKEVLLRHVLSENTEVRPVARRVAHTSARCWPRSHVGMFSNI